MPWYFVVLITIGSLIILGLVIALLSNFLSKQERKERWRLRQERHKKNIEYSKQQTREALLKNPNLEEDTLREFTNITPQLLGKKIHWYVIKDWHHGRWVGIGSDFIPLSKSRYRAWGSYKNFGAALYSSLLSSRTLYPSNHTNKWKALGEFKWKEAHHLLPRRIYDRTPYQ